MAFKHIKFNKEQLHEQIPELVDIEHHTGESSCVDDSDELVLIFAGGKQISIYYDTMQDCIVVELD